MKIFNRFPQIQVKRVDRYRTTQTDTKRPTVHPIYAMKRKKNRKSFISYPHSWWATALGQTRITGAGGNDPLTSRLIVVLYIRKCADSFPAFHTICRPDNAHASDVAQGRTHLLLRGRTWLYAPRFAWLQWCVCLYRNTYRTYCTAGHTLSMSRARKRMSVTRRVHVEGHAYMYLYRDQHGISC